MPIFSKLFSVRKFDFVIYICIYFPYDDFYCYRKKTFYHLEHKIDIKITVYYRAHKVSSWFLMITLKNNRNV